MKKHEEMVEEPICPRCGERCGREEADVGVGIIYGPYGCGCGWSEDEYYDVNFSGGFQPDGSYLAPKGEYYSAEHPVIKMVKLMDEKSTE